MSAGAQPAGLEGSPPRPQQAQARNVMLCVDSLLETSMAAVNWTLARFVATGDRVHVVTVLPVDATAAGLPAGDLAGTASAVLATAEQCRLAAIETVKAVLKAVKTHNSDLAVYEDILDPHGGASGVANSIIEYAAAKHITVVVMGSRGHGAFRRGLDQIFGLGSVSDHCIRHLHCPVVCIKSGTTLNSSMPSSHPPRVCLAVDNSAHSHDMVKWAAKHIILPQDEVHLISVCDTHLPMEYTSSTVGDIKVEAESAVRTAKQLLEDSGIGSDSVVTQLLLPAGGASDVGKSISDYVNKHDFAVAVVGNREEHGFQRFVSSVLLDKGSVSIDCAHNVRCPVAIFKHRLKHEM